MILDPVFIILTIRLVFTFAGPALAFIRFVSVSAGPILTPATSTPSTPIILQSLSGYPLFLFYFILVIWVNHC
jgi:hypothetical protein